MIRVTLYVLLIDRWQKCWALAQLKEMQGQSMFRSHDVRFQRFNYFIYNDVVCVF